MLETRNLIALKVGQIPAKPLRSFFGSFDLDFFPIAGSVRRKMRACSMLADFMDFWISELTEAYAYARTIVRRPP